MTREETILRARDLWQEVTGSLTWGDDFGASAELSAVVDELCDRKKIWYGSRFVDLVAGQREYSLRGVVKLESVWFGSTRLDVLGSAVANRRYPGWRTVSSGTVYRAVNAGTSLFLVAPPSATTAGGLELIGFLRASGLWEGMGDENPTPGWSHEAAALGLAARRAALYPGDGELRAKAAVLLPRFEAAARSLEPLAAAAWRSLNGR